MAMIRKCWRFRRMILSVITVVVCGFKDMHYACEWPVGYIIMWRNRGVSAVGYGRKIVKRKYNFI